MINKWPGHALCEGQPAQNPPHLQASHSGGSRGSQLPLQTHLGVLLPGRHVNYRLLDPEGRNEDVDHHDDENQPRGQVVKEV